MKLQVVKKGEQAPIPILAVGGKGSAWTHTRVPTDGIVVILGPVETEGTFITRGKLETALELLRELDEEPKEETDDDAEGISGDFKISK